MQVTSSTSNPVPVTWVESLFKRMSALYGNKFVDMWKGTDIQAVKELWAEEMGKLTREDLKRGYDGLMKRDWPPSLPEFVSMCRPEIDVLVAYYEALAGVTDRSRGEVGKWSHPAIFWAATPLTFELLNQTYSQIKQSWESALKVQLAKGQWESIPAPTLQLEAPKSPNSRKNAEKTMQDLGVAKALKPRTDHRAWISKVLNDKNAPMIARKFAKEAQTVKEHDL
jgi:hypothetical protein